MAHVTTAGREFAQRTRKNATTMEQSAPRVLSPAGRAPWIELPLKVDSPPARRS